VTPVEVVAITPAHLTQAPRCPEPLHLFARPRAVQPPRARWLGVRWLELVPLLAVLCWGVEVEVRAGE